MIMLQLVMKLMNMINFKVHDFLSRSDPEGILVHFNLHFNSDKQSRLFNREIQVCGCTARHSTPIISS